MHRTQQDERALEIIDLRQQRIRESGKKQGLRWKGPHADGKVLAEIEFQSNAQMLNVISKLNRAKTIAREKHHESLAVKHAGEAHDFLETISEETLGSLLQSGTYDVQGNLECGFPFVKSHAVTGLSVDEVALRMAQPTAISALLGGGGVVECVEHVSEVSQNCELFRVLFKPRWIGILYFNRREWIVKRFVYFDHKTSSYVVLFKSVEKEETGAALKELKGREKRESDEHDGDDGSGEVIPSVDPHSTRDKVNFLGFRILQESVEDEAVGSRITYALSVEYNGWARLYPRSFIRDSMVSHLSNIAHFVGLFEGPLLLDQELNLSKPLTFEDELEDEYFYEDGSNPSTSESEEAQGDSPGNDKPSANCCFPCFSVGSSQKSVDKPRSDEVEEKTQEDSDNPDEVEPLRWESVDFGSASQVLDVKAHRRYEGSAAKLHLIAGSDTFEKLRIDRPANNRVVLIHLTTHVASISFYFETDAEELKSAPALAGVLRTFVEEQALDHQRQVSKSAADTRRKEMLFVQPKFVYGAALAKRIIGEKRTNLALKCPCECFVGHRYVEMDVDLSKSLYMKTLLELILRSPKLVLEVAFMLDDGSPREQGLLRLGCVRFKNPSLESLEFEEIVKERENH